MKNTLFLVPLLLLSAACSQPAPEPSDGAENAAPTAEPQTVQTQAPPPADGGGPLAPATSRNRGPSSQPTALSSGPVGHQVQAPGATFALPAAWIPQAPSSSMRLAQASIPGPGGEGQLTVFHFGPGGGGGVDNNLQRWEGQIEPDSGFASQRQTFDAGPFRVTWMEAKGTLKASTMGTGPTSPQSNSRLFGAVVEGDQGPWYFKATGPAETLDQQRSAFLDLLRSMRPAA